MNEHAERDNRPLTAGRGKEKRIAAFFDLDETLVSINTMSEFYWYYARRRACRSSLPGVRMLEKAGHMSAACGRYMGLFFTSLADKSRVSVNKRYFGSLHGVNAEEYCSLALQWFSKFSGPSMFNREVVNRLHDHQSRTHVTVLISGSHNVLARHIADSVGIGHTIATDLEVKNGYFSGKMLNPQPLVSLGKVHAMRDFAQTYHIDLMESYAYSDHSSDIAMLEAVGHPCVVAGDKRLMRTAVRRNWQIIQTKELEIA